MSGKGGEGKVWGTKSVCNEGRGGCWVAVYEIRAKGRRQGLGDKVEEGDEMKKGAPGWRRTV